MGVGGGSGSVGGGGDEEEEEDEGQRRRRKRHGVGGCGERETSEKPLRFQLWFGKLAASLEYLFILKFTNNCFHFSVIFDSELEGNGHASKGPDL